MYAFREFADGRHWQRSVAPAVVEFAERELVSAAEVAHFLAALECCNFHWNVATYIAASQWTVAAVIAVAVAKTN